MSANTKIEWADATVNWWAGCTAISPACDHCYAKQMAGRLWGVQWGPGQPRMQFTGPLEALRALDRKAQRLGRPLRVFHNSMSDFFDNEVPHEWREQAFQAMEDTPNLIHLLLTKRIGNVGNMLPVPFDFDRLYPNVWLGITVVNQEEADRDIPKLLDVLVAKRFLSMEPLLGPVDLTRVPMHDTCASECCGNWRIDVLKGASYCGDVERDPRDENDEAESRIDWIIVGGESGHGARPMHPDWARSLRDQCQAAGVPFLFKQWGEYAEWTGAESPSPSCRVDDMTPMVHVGKKAAGRLLDGRTWDEVPA